MRLWASTCVLQISIWRYAVLIILIILLLLLFGSFPVYPDSRNWGYRGSGVLGTILLIVLIVWLVQNI
jgi:hypothetical protein